MSVGDLYDVERTGEFAVAPTKVRRRPAARQALVQQPNAASGGVAITVLTHDAALADAIHDAAAANHPVTIATTPNEAVELAASGRCGILITDQVSTQPVLRRMTQRVREAEPALVVIAVGGTGDQNGLISLLSAGVVDRLMLKPVTPALAQIVLKSAAQQHRTLGGAAVAPIEHREPAVVLVDLQRQAANQVAEGKLDLDLDLSPAEVVAPASTISPARAARGFDFRRPSWMVVVAALLAVVGLTALIASQRKPTIDAQAVIASNLAAGQRAFREGHALEPRGSSALDYYNTVLALDPANAAARQGIDQVADRFAANASKAIAQGQLAAALVDLESLQRVRPDHRQLPQLRSQFDAAQGKLVAAATQHVEPAPPPVANAAPPQAVVLASSLQQNVIGARARAMAQASEALKRDQLELASALINEARMLGAPAADLANLNQTLTNAQQRREKDELVHLATAEKNFDQATQLLTQAHEGDFGGTAAPLAPIEPAPAAPTLKVARMVKPDYPNDALVTGAEGWVNVSMSVTPAGNVLDPRVVQRSNGTQFDRAALSAVRKWKYEPFAAAQPQSVTVRVEFRMKDRR
ncbi:MAG TPA: energy transducer TonB [Steroidobacteraceae bacterium]|jgi:protein TonB